VTGQDPSEAVLAHIAAFNAGDVEQLVAGFAPDAIFVNGSTSVRGHSDLARFFGDAIRVFRPSLTVTNLLGGGQHVACELVERVESDGETRLLDKAAFYRVVDGRIVSGRVYIDDPADP
jgi:hypothetical protein